MRATKEKLKALQTKWQEKGSLTKEHFCCVIHVGCEMDGRVSHETKEEGNLGVVTDVLLKEEWESVTGQALNNTNTNNGNDDGQRVEEEGEEEGK